MADRDGQAGLRRQLLQLHLPEPAPAQTHLLDKQASGIHPHCTRHTCAVLSALPEAMRMPSGDHATVHTGSECPR